MKTNILLSIILAALLLSGCQTRSISDSGYERNYNFRGELSELEVLGVNASKKITEADITEAVNRKGTINLQRGARIVLIQSGAQFPDSGMMAEAEKFYKVIPLSGVPERPAAYPHRSIIEDPTVENASPLDMALRLAAARAGAKTLIVYWGVLESAREGYATKTVSWVPIVGSLLPDEDQEIRIRLKVAVIDVETGYWEMLTPEVFQDKRTSAHINRENSDQRQVELLKTKGYKRLIADLQTRYDR